MRHAMPCFLVTCNAVSCYVRLCFDGSVCHLSYVAMLLLCMAYSVLFCLEFHTPTQTQACLLKRLAGWNPQDLEAFLDGQSTFVVSMALRV